MRMKKIAFPFLFLLIISTFSSIILVTAQTSLNLTIATNKQTTYDKYDPITLSGTLLSGGVSPDNALVGIQVNFPNSNEPLVLRTVQTGSGTLSSLSEQINSAFLSNLGGGQVSTIQSGGTAYFTASVTDQDGQEHDNMLLAVTVFDGNGVPLGVGLSQMTVDVGAPQTATVGVPIYSWAHSGTAYGYADLYSGYPQNGGVPMASEASFQFKISGGTPSSGPAPTTSSATAGAYSLTFKLPPERANFPDGACKVYASTYYSKQYATAQTGFNVLLIGDFNLQDSVTGNDLFLFASAYISYYSQQSYNTFCDINGDGKVDATDFFLFVSAYIQYWSP